jgi:hypothetical protein
LKPIKFALGKIEGSVTGKLFTVYPCSRNTFAYWLFIGVPPLVSKRFQWEKDMYVCIYIYNPLVNTIKISHFQPPPNVNSYFNIVGYISIVPN